VTALAWLVPAALLLGALGLLAFLWALRSGQFEDLEGAAYRALEDEAPGRCHSSIEVEAKKMFRASLNWTIVKQRRYLSHRRLERTPDTFS
jgi:cbb3-type cytochrome oxidase maturation protein